MSSTPKLVVTTGASSGLGFEALCQLVSREEPYKVYVGARKPLSEACLRTLASCAKSSATSFEHVTLDLQSIESVKSFAAEIQKAVKGAKIDILLLCAGVYAAKRQFISVDFGKGSYDSEFTLLVNALAQFHLVDLLYSDLAADARVAIVNSALHQRAARNGALLPSNLDEWLSEKQWGGLSSYGASKLVAMYFAQILKRKFTSSPDTAKRSVISSHPGFVPDTSLQRDNHWAVGWVMTNVLPWMPFATSVQAGGAVIARSMFDSNLESGCYTSPKGVEAYASQCDNVGSQDAWAEWLKAKGIWTH